MAQCATTALAGAVPGLCVRGARGRFWGARAGTWCCVSPLSPFPPRVSRAVFGGPSCPGVPYPRLLVRHSTRSVRSASSVRLPLWYSPRALCVFVRSRSRGVRFPPAPPLGGVAQAPRAIPALGAGRAVPRGPCPSACPAPVPCSVWRSTGGAARSCSPLPGLGLRVRGVPAPGAAVWRGGGGLCTAPPICAAGGASGAGDRSALCRPSALPGQATKRVSLASFWSWRAWPPYCSGSCSLAVTERGPCGALARWCGFACSPRFLWEQAAGAGGRALLRPPSRAPRSRRGAG